MEKKRSWRGDVRDPPLFLDLTRNKKGMFNMDLLWIVYLSESPGVLENSISG